MSYFATPRRHVLPGSKPGHRHNAVRAAVETMETRVLLSVYSVNTFVDQTDPPTSATVSLRDALALAAAHPGPDTIDVPAGEYKLIQSELVITDTSGAVTIQGVGGLATIDANSKFASVIDTGDSVAILSNLDITGAALSAAVQSDVTLTMTDSIISGNASAALLDAQHIVLSGVTISNNGGGIYGGYALSLFNCTISGNRGSGISSEHMSLYDSTVVNNQEFGLDCLAGKVTIGNSIVAGNGNSGDDVTFDGFLSGSALRYNTNNTALAGLVSQGGNVIGEIGTTTGWVSSDRLGDTNNPLDPRLAPLGNYGGPVPTMPPLAGSYALNGGVASAIPVGVTTDQRGLPRVADGAVDSGAVEIQGPPVIELAPIAAQQFTIQGMVYLGTLSAPGLNGPFVVDVRWGDGTPDQAFTVTSAGTIPAAFHKFGQAGAVEISVAATDSAGHLSNAALFQADVVGGPPTSFVINTTRDQTDPVSSNTVSLRDAVTRASQLEGPVNITFTPAVFATAQTLKLTGKALTFGGNPFGITVDGPAAGLTIDLSASDGLVVLRGAVVSLHSLNLTGGPTYSNYLFSNEGNLTVDHSTISGFTFGLYNTGSLTLTNSGVTEIGSAGATSQTIVNAGSAVINDCTCDIVEDTGHAVITDTTIASILETENPDYGIPIVPGGNLKLSNSIVGDVSGTIQSLGHNLISEKDSSTGWIASDLTGTVAHPLDPKLSPPGNYGGKTITRFPLPDSPALAAGSAAFVPAGAMTDQRGFTRIVNGKVDIGAFQSQSAAVIAITPPAPQSAVAGVLKTVALGSLSDPGGSGPFIVTVTWADGSPAAVFTANHVGQLGTLDHTFIATGTLVNSIVVVDSAGDLKEATLVVASATAPLKTIVVNTTKDVADAAGNSTVSLRDAINRADASFGPVNITFGPKAFNTFKTIALVNDIPTLQDNHFGTITFVGPAVGVAVKSHIVYVDDGHGDLLPTGNAFTVASGIVASFSNFTFKQLGLVNSGSLTIVNSTITGNRVDGGRGAGIENYGTVMLADSTLSGNDAELFGAPGSLGGFGGAIENKGTFTIVNSTISGNSASLGGGGIDNEGNLSIFNSTISENDGGSDGAIYNEPASATSHPKAKLANTIVAGNYGSDVSGAVISAGHNLIGETDGSTGWTAADLTGTAAQPLNANLSPLGNNGGPTQTQIPLPGSPALGVGSVALIPAGITTDQRGLLRVVDGKVDIGSIEIAHATPFGGTPVPFGRIQAENFDLGGQGAGYYDPGNINRGGAYRPNEGVGIGAIPGADGSGFAVGWTAAGEFLDYTVSVADSGTYALNFRVSSRGKGGKFHLNVDGQNVTGSLSIPATGDWNTFKIVSKAGVKLTAGKHVAQLVIDAVGVSGAAGNFDWFEAV